MNDEFESVSFWRTIVVCAMIGGCVGAFLAMIGT